jgi:hypothetical protein
MNRSAMFVPPDGLERIPQLRKDNGVVNSSLMDMPREQSADALQSALRAARENENRWVGITYQQHRSRHVQVLYSLDGSDSAGYRR